LLGRVALARGEPERARPLLEAFRVAAGQAEGPEALWGPASHWGALLPRPPQVTAGEVVVQRGP
jgi:hypothetical protein